MCSRDKIVVNGCSGKCCEAFTLPFSISDFKKNDAAIKAGEYDFIDENGYKRGVIKDETRDVVLDMLIDLGEVETDPQMGDSFTERFKHLSDEDLMINTRGFHFRKEGKVYGRLFTCRHFDKENRICSNYEGRPNLCRHFGSECGYSGCGFKKKMEFEEITGEGLKVAMDMCASDSICQNGFTPDLYYVADNEVDLFSPKKPEELQAVAEERMLAFDIY